MDTFTIEEIVKFDGGGGGISTINSNNDNIGIPSNTFEMIISTIQHFLDRSSSVASTIAVFVLSFILFFMFGWFYFLKILFRDYEVKKVFVQLSFSITFALSLTLFELIFFEIMDFMDREWRYRFWEFDLTLMSINLILVLPYYQFYLLVLAYGFSKRKTLFFSLVLLVLYLILFWKIGDPFPILKEYTGLVSLEMGIGRIGIVGCTVMSLLSGYGAVYVPYSYITYFLKPVKDVTITKLEKQFNHALDKIFNKKKRVVLLKRELTRRNVNNNNNNNNNYDTYNYNNNYNNNSNNNNNNNNSNNNNNNNLPIIGPIFSKIYNLWNVGYHHQLSRPIDDIKQLEREIKQLEDLNRDLFTQIHELKLERLRIQFSTTLRGKFYNWLGYFFSIYCIYKVIMSALNIVFDRRGGMDPVTRGLDIALRYFHFQVDVTFWSQHISFILVGLMTASSIRGFLNQILKVFHEYSSSLSSNNIVLILAQVMGMYFISSVLMMRTSMPEIYTRFIVTQILGDIEFSFYHRWFDFIFIPSAIITTLALIFMSKSSTFHLNDE
ncbi:hypothetical protein ACTFIT_006676 [Dictyostelium discoideum]